jgi:D-tagatose-1,6-bisphosphate aldolase subunit GatZ/KbaZ
MTALTEIVAQNRAGRPVAIASVCTAQPEVIVAALLLAKSRGQDVLIEATSNQVNQFGGYTGMAPADYITFVHDLAADHDVDPALIHFGGDHLGPQVWRAQNAEVAMGHARDMMRAYVEAGFTKIHLDCSEGCAGEPAQVDDETSARRAADLAAVCEAHAPDPSKLTYVIGTEVPPPGGARADEAGAVIQPTNPDRAYHTLVCHRTAFAAADVMSAWPRIIGLVVQPGLEFAPTHVDRFDISAPNPLSAALRDEPHICFEAHSTVYQFDAVFPALSGRNFAVLKVGPALTFAYRQALYALDHIRARLNSDHTGTAVSDVMEQVMLEAPANWQKHYAGDANSLRLQRHFGYADRIRYYWPTPKAQEAVAGLFADLPDQIAPRPLLEQYFAPGVISRADRLNDAADNWAQALILAQIQTALAPYFFEVE